jgi:hypothetical protein
MGPQWLDQRFGEASRTSLSLQEIPGLGRWSPAPKAHDPLKLEKIPMFTFPFFRRQDDRPTARRPQPWRRPLVESLEGRQLLATFMATNLQTPAIVGQHIGVTVDAVEGGGGVGQHIGVTVDAAKGGGGVGQHIG